MAADYTLCARIVRQRMRTIRGRRIGTMLDAEDIEQELMFQAHRAAAQVQEGFKGTAYIRKCVDNAVRDLYATTFAAKRYPRDEYGRPMAAFINPDLLSSQVDTSAANPEAQAALRETVEKVAAGLPPRYSDLIRSCANGDGELSQRQARYIRYLLKVGGINE